MVQIWVWIFVPATVLLCLGVGFRVVALAPGASPVPVEPWQCGLGILITVAASLAWTVVQRPNLGASD